MNYTPDRQAATFLSKQHVTTSVLADLQDNLFLYVCKSEFRAKNTPDNLKWIHLNTRENRLFLASGRVVSLHTHLVCFQLFLGSHDPISRRMYR